MKFDPRFFQTVLFYKSPDIVADVVFKNINKEIVSYIERVEFDSNTNVYTAFNFMHTYDELYMEIIHENKVIYDELFFRNQERVYINKKDLTFLIDSDRKIDRFINHYNKYGEVVFNVDLSSIETKYIVLLKDYLVNVPFFLNRLIYNYDYITINENNTIKGGKKINFLNSQPEIVLNNIKVLDINKW